jgi:putative phosphoesterase
MLSAMILGVLSDSHGRVRETTLAVNLLERLGAQALVHCGDLGGEAVLDTLAGRRAWFVWGNTDFPDVSVERYAQTLGLTPPAAVPVRLTLAGRTIAVFHGHEPGFARLDALLRRGDVEGLAAATGGVDYILFGHTHVAADERAGDVRLVNPGALHRARPRTVVTIDLEADSVEHWVVQERDSTTEAAPVRYPLEP